MATRWRHRRVDRLQQVAHCRGRDSSGAGFAVAGPERVGPDLADANPLELPGVVAGLDHDLGFVQPGLRFRIDERLRLEAGQLRQQIVHGRLCDVMSRPTLRRHLPHVWIARLGRFHFLELVNLRTGRRGAHNAQAIDRERAELEEILLAVVAEVLLQVVAQRRVEGEHGWPRAVLRIHVVCFGLADQEHGPGALRTDRDRLRRLVQTVFLEIGRVLLDQLRHVRSRQPAQQALDEAVIASRGHRLHHLPFAPRARQLDRLGPARQRQQVGLVAVELQDLLVAQIERLAIEIAFLERRDQKHLLVVWLHRVHVALGRCLVADGELAGDGASLERQFDRRLGEPVGRQVFRVVVERTVDLELCQRGGKPARFGCVGVGGDRLDHLPAAVRLAQQARLAVEGEPHLVDFVGLDAEHLSLRRPTVDAPRGTPVVDEVDVTAESGEDDNQNQC
jgi:hypothetical protein